MTHLLAFLSLYVGSFIWSFLYHRAYAFMAYLMVYFFYPLGPARWWSYSLPGIPYSFSTTLLMIMVYILNFQDSNKNRCLAAPQLVYAYLFGTYFYCLIIVAVNPDLHAMFSSNFVKLLIVITLAYKLVDTHKMFNIILFAYIGGTSYIGLLVNIIGRNSGDRVEGIGTVDGPDANDMAALLAPALVLILYWFWVDSRLKIRVPMLIAGAITANAIVLVNSRGSFLGVLASCSYFMFYLYFSKFRRKGQKATVIVLICLGLVALLNVVDQSTLERFYSIADSTEVNEEEETGATRMLFWVAAYELAKDHPFGLGYAAFNSFADEYLPQGIDTGASRSRTVHSSWFQALSEAGFPGLMLYLLIYFFCFLTLRRCRKVAIEYKNIPLYYKIIALEAALVGYMVPMTFINRMTAVVPFILVLFSACAYNIYVLRKNELANQLN